MKENHNFIGFRPISGIRTSDQSNPNTPADPGSSRSVGCPELILELSIALARYPEERRHDQTCEGLFEHLDVKRTGIKETEACGAACQ